MIIIFVSGKRIIFELEELVQSQEIKTVVYSSLIKTCTKLNYAVNTWSTVRPRHIYCCNYYITNKYLFNRIKLRIFNRSFSMISIEYQSSQTKLFIKWTVYLWPKAYGPKAMGVKQYWKLKFWSFVSIQRWRGTESGRLRMASVSKQW